MKVRIPTGPKTKDKELLTCLNYLKERLNLTMELEKLNYLTESTIISFNEVEQHYNTIINKYKEFGEMPKLTLRLSDGSEMTQNPYKLRMADFMRENIGVGKVKMGLNRLRLDNVYPDFKVARIDKNDNLTCAFVEYTEKPEYLYCQIDGNGWMSTLPTEIYSMEAAMNEIGKVNNLLVFGIGLGYFPFMCANNGICKNFTIVELEQDVIDIFTEYILPKFPSDVKIEIIKGNAYEIITNEELTSKFDRMFVDTYQSNHDGEISYYIYEYLLSGKQKPVYWIEDKITYNLRQTIRGAILVMAHEEVGIGRRLYDSIETLYAYTCELIINQTRKYYNQVLRGKLTAESIKCVMEDMDIVQKVLSFTSDLPKRLTDYAYDSSIPEIHRSIDMINVGNTVHKIVDEKSISEVNKIADSLSDIQIAQLATLFNE